MDFSLPPPTNEEDLSAPTVKMRRVSFPSSVPLIPNEAPAPLAEAPAEIAHQITAPLVDLPISDINTDAEAAEDIPDPPLDLAVVDEVALPAAEPSIMPINKLPDGAFALPPEVPPADEPASVFTWKQTSMPHWADDPIPAPKHEEPTAAAAIPAVLLREPLYEPLYEEHWATPALAVSPSAPLPLTDTDDEDEERSTVKSFEYCRLVLDSGQYSQIQGRYPYFVRVSLDYYGANTVPSYKFNQDTDKMEGPDKTWGQMIGLLGAAGWEMINLTIGKAKDLSILEAMAYFKRPIEEGRAIDQPEIKL